MQKLIGNNPHGRLFILSAPAGTGKTTLVRMLRDEFAQVAESISYTTRQPRLNEVDGKDYHFVSKETFKKMVIHGDFLEFVELYGEMYGTSQLEVDKQLVAGKHVFLVIDTQGALHVRSQRKVPLIFLAPPSLVVLKERLIKRGTENEREIIKRLEWAKNEMDVIRHYDYLIVNEDLDVAYAVLRSILIAEDHKII